MKKHYPEWLKKAVFYQIYPASFYDSNGDGIGDLNGITQKLAYVKSLNCNAIWLSPCFASPFKDGGYDVSDFYQVAPRYGNNEDLKNLFEQAHKLGIKVILDLVAGHSSIECNWFKEASKVEKNHYTNYYIWGNSADAPQYRYINGMTDKEESFMINYYYCQAALNYGFCPPDPKAPWQLPCDHVDVIALREEIKNVMKFYLDMGCDGFRVDMASSLIRGANAAQGIKDLWQYYRNFLNEYNPEAVLVSEWSHPAKAIEAGFHVDFMVFFNLPGYSSLLRGEPYRVTWSEFTFEHSFFDQDGLGDAELFCQDLITQLTSVDGKGFVSVPTGNHDTGRIAQNRDTQDMKILYSMLLLLPGVPFIYYGDEIGQDYVYNLPTKEGGYKRTGSRTPMQWDSTLNAGFSNADPKDLYLPIMPNSDRPTVANEEENPDSLLNFTRKLLALRNANEALDSEGKFKLLYVEKNQYPLVFERFTANQRFVVAVNPANRECECQIACPNWDLFKQILGDKLVKALDIYGAIKIIMPPKSYAIYSYNGIID